MDYAHKINLCCGVYGIYLTLKEVPGCKKFDNPWATDAASSQPHEYSYY